MVTRPGPLPDSLGEGFSVRAALREGVTPGRLRGTDLAVPFRGTRLRSTNHVLPMPGSPCIRARGRGVAGRNHSPRVRLPIDRPTARLLLLCHGGGVVGAATAEPGTSRRLVSQSAGGCQPQRSCAPIYRRGGGCAAPSHEDARYSGPPCDGAADPRAGDPGNPADRPGNDVGTSRCASVDGRAHHPRRRHRARAEGERHASGSTGIWPGHTETSSKQR